MRPRPSTPLPLLSAAIFLLICTAEAPRAQEADDKVAGTLAARVDRLEAIVGRQAKRGAGVPSMASRLAAVEARLKAAEHAHPATTAKLQRRVESLERLAKDMDRQVRGLVTRLERLERGSGGAPGIDTRALQHDLRRIQNEMSDLRRRIDRLE